MKMPLRCALALGCFFVALTLQAQTLRPLRVLFIGNSLTAGNNVPELVQGMAALQGVDIQYTVMAPGGYAIEDHWRDGNYRLLESGNYHVVVLQQGPSTLASSQANLREWTVAWAAQARRFGTRPALYMIWPLQDHVGGFELVSQSYRNAAFAADAAIFPAGEAWQQAIRLNPGIGLYTDDNLHATPAGSFLAAMVIARGLVSLEPSRVPASVRGVNVSTSTLTTFRGVVESLPPSSMSSDAPPAPANPTPVTTPAPTTPTTPAASASTSASGGGGAPSLWFLGALLIAGIARWQRPAGAR